MNNHVYPIDVERIQARRAALAKSRSLQLRDPSKQAGGVHAWRLHVYCRSNGPTLINSASKHRTGLCPHAHRTDGG